MNLDNREERVLRKECKSKNDEIKNILGRNKDNVDIKDFTSISEDKQINKHELQHSQRAFIVIVGEEIGEGLHGTALSDTAKRLRETFGEEKSYNLEEIKSGDFRDIEKNEIIYLIAHGDDTEFAKKPGFGDKDGKGIKEIVKKILTNFSKKHDGEKFAGEIILEGCHSAEPVLSENRKFAQGGSMLYELQQSMEADKFFKRNMEAEVTISGYLGQAFEGEYSISHHGVACTSNPLTLIYQKGAGEKNSDGSMRYNESESFLSSRWGRNLQFGMPKNKHK